MGAIDTKRGCLEESWGFLRSCAGSALPSKQKSPPLTFAGVSRGLEGVGRKRVLWPDPIAQSGRCRQRWGRVLWVAEKDRSLKDGWRHCQAWDGHLPVQISSSPISCTAGISRSSPLLPAPAPPPPPPPPLPPPPAAPAAAAVPPATEPFIWPSSARENTDFLGGKRAGGLPILGRAQPLQDCPQNTS